MSNNLDFARRKGSLCIQREARGFVTRRRCSDDLRAWRDSRSIVKDFLSSETTYCGYLLVTRALYPLRLRDSQTSTAASTLVCRF